MVRPVFIIIANDSFGTDKLPHGEAGAVRFCPAGSLNIWNTAILCDWNRLARQV